MNQWTIEVSDSDFDTEVLERSKQVPVLVDFWAPWCGPCRVLGPVLEKLAAEYSGAFILAKINVDENPGLASDFGIQGIPAVKLLRDGKIAGEFTGALPEPMLREILSRFLPSELDNQAEEAAKLEREGNASEAKMIYQRVLEKDPNHSKSLLGLGRLLMNEGNEPDALKYLEKISLAADERKQAEPLISRFKLRGDGNFDESKLRDALKSDPNNLQARFDLAQALAAEGNFKEALAEFLWLVRADRGFNDDGARKAMIQIFEVLGPDNPLVDKYRSELAKVLFS